MFKFLAKNDDENGALRALADALGQGVTQLVLTAKQTGASLCVTRLAECEGGRVREGVRVREGGCFGASEGAPVEVPRSRVGVWLASVGGLESEKNSWAVALSANFRRHTGGGGGGGARTAPSRYKCIGLTAPMSAVSAALGQTVSGAGALRFR